MTPQWTIFSGLCILLGWTVTSDCFAMLCWLLLYKEVNQLHRPGPPGPSAPAPFHAFRSSWSTTLTVLPAPCSSSRLAMCLQECIYVSDSLPVHLFAPFPRWVHKSILYLQVSVPALQTRCFRKDCVFIVKGRHSISTESLNNTSCQPFKNTKVITACGHFYSPFESMCT